MALFLSLFLFSSLLSLFPDQVLCVFFSLLLFFSLTFSRETCCAHMNIHTHTPLILAPLSFQRVFCSPPEYTHTHIFSFPFSTPRQPNHANVPSQEFNQGLILCAHLNPSCYFVVVVIVEHLVSHQFANKQTYK